MPSYNTFLTRSMERVLQYAPTSDSYCCSIRDYCRFAISSFPISSFQAVTLSCHPFPRPSSTLSPPSSSPACPLSSLRCVPDTKSTTAVPRRAAVAGGARAASARDPAAIAGFSGEGSSREETSEAGGGRGSPSSKGKGPPQAASMEKPPSSKQLSPSTNSANESTSSTKADLASKARKPSTRTEVPDHTTSPGSMPEPTGTAAVAPDSAASAAGAAVAAAGAAGGASKAARGTGDASSSKGGVARPRSKGGESLSTKATETNDEAGGGLGGVVDSSAVGKEDDATFSPFRRKKQKNSAGVAAAPETTAAEKVRQRFHSIHEYSINSTWCTYLIYLHWSLCLSFFGLYRLEIFNGWWAFRFFFSCAKLHRILPCAPHVCVHADGDVAYTDETRYTSPQVFAFLFV